MYYDFIEKLTPATFERWGKTYEVYPCTAVALEAGDTEADRQQALYVVLRTAPGEERFDSVVFGWEFAWLKADEDFASMCDDASAWSQDWETLETIKPII